MLTTCESAGTVKIMSAISCVGFTDLRLLFETFTDCHLLALANVYTPYININDHKVFSNNKCQHFLLLSLYINLKLVSYVMTEIVSLAKN